MPATAVGDDAPAAERPDGAESLAQLARATEPAGLRVEQVAAADRLVLPGDAARPRTRPARAR